MQGRKITFGGIFFSEGTKKTAKTGKEFGKEGKKAGFFFHISFTVLYESKRVKNDDGSTGQLLLRKRILSRALANGLLLTKSHNIRSEISSLPISARHRN